MLTAFSMVGAICGGTLFGLFSDRWGRRRAMVVALLAAVLVVPLWAFAPSLALLWAGAFLMQFLVQGAWGVVPAHLSELSPDSVRGFLPGFGYQCGVTISGLVSYVEASIAGRTGYATAMAIVAASVFLLAAAATAAGKRAAGRVFRRAARLAAIRAGKEVHAHARDEVDPGDDQPGQAAVIRQEKVHARLRRTRQVNGVGR